MITAKLIRERPVAFMDNKPRRLPGQRNLFMTAELSDLFQTTRLAEHGVSHLADNVLLLEYLRENSTVRRVLTVLKTRASGHEPESREYTISPEGIVLGPAIGADSAV